MTFNTIEYFNHSLVDELDCLDINYPIYELNGIVEHTGGLQGGHYYSKCKNENGWWLLNDSYVSPITELDVENQQNTYILFLSIRS